MNELSQAQETAKRVLAQISDIQAPISISGLEEESTALKQMKADIIKLIADLTPAHPRMDLVVAGCKTDAMDAMETLLKAQLAIIGKGEQPTVVVVNTDAQLAIMHAAAAVFVDRCEDYFESKKQLASFSSSVNHIEGGVFNG